MPIPERILPEFELPPTLCCLLQKPINGDGILWNKRGEVMRERDLSNPEKVEEVKRFFK